MRKYYHYDREGTARFVTFGTHAHYPLLRMDSLSLIVLHHLGRLREDQKIKILAYVIMPDHVHLVLLPPDDVKLGRAIGQIKGRAAQEILDYYRRNSLAIPDELCTPERDGYEHAIWQPRCYDRNIRTTEELRAAITYCHRNPVRRGLVPSPEQWQWSSYNWYCGHKVVPLTIDEIDF